MPEFTTETWERAVEKRAREIYLARYWAIGGIWEAVETKDVWRDIAEKEMREERADGRI
jgi:hypothetical protein